MKEHSKQPNFEMGEYGLLVVISLVESDGRGQKVNVKVRIKSLSMGPMPSRSGHQ